jgi:hypothetical protein
MNLFLKIMADLKSGRVCRRGRGSWGSVLSSGSGQKISSWSLWYVVLSGSDPFDCDGGLHCVCDVYDPGFDSKYGDVQIGWCVYVARGNYGGRVLCPYDSALGTSGV